MSEAVVEHLKNTRKLAEAAVADMPDGELKNCAFEVAFTYLLGHPKPTHSVAARHNAEPPLEHKANRAPQTPTERLLAIREEQFFSEPKSLGEVQTELKKHGWHYAVERLGTPLVRLVQQKQLRRERIADGAKKVWKYVNV